SPLRSGKERCHHVLHHPVRRSHRAAIDRRRRRHRPHRSEYRRTPRPCPPGGGAGGEGKGGRRGPTGQTIVLCRLSTSLSAKHDRPQKAMPCPTCSASYNSIIMLTPTE